MLLGGSNVLLCLIPVCLLFSSPLLSSPLLSSVSGSSPLLYWPVLSFPVLSQSVPVQKFCLCCLVFDVNNSTSVDVYNIPYPSANSCLVLLRHGFNQSGQYTINPDGNGEFNVFCDMTTDGGGWTIIQRRESGTVHFDRNWNEYRDGFGDVTGELWLGNDRLHRLTFSGLHNLRVDLEDWGGATSYAEYENVIVSGASLNYGLTVGAYSGTAGNALKSAAFSTRDRDNDESDGFNCASHVSSGGWWLGSSGSDCGESFLNGPYNNGSLVQHLKGIMWVPWKGNTSSLRKTEIKIRPRLANQDEFGKTSRSACYIHITVA